MPEYALLISPRAWSAFFAETLDVAQSELAGLKDVTPGPHRHVGGMDFLTVEAAPERVQDLRRLACVQGLFQLEGGAMHPVESSPGFALHPDFIWGEKYRGKTNETLTQMLLNIGLQERNGPARPRVLDPMCGRGTTLLWAMRYGLPSVGIERDATVLPELRRGLKKWTKLHRQKHKLSEGWVQKTNKAGIGKFLSFAAGAQMQLIIGDTKDAHDLTHRKPFDLIVTDIPYGVQHLGDTGTRTPINTLLDAAAGWTRALVPGGVAVIAFNANIPKRADLRAAFPDLDCVDRPFAHRMSESILRDILVLKKPAA